MSNITKGTIEATACPWCRKPNDFRSVEDYGLEKGNVLTCDHCKRNFKIKNVRKMTVIYLEPYSGRGNLHGG